MQAARLHEDVVFDFSDASSDGSFDSSLWTYQSVFLSVWADNGATVTGYVDDLRIVK